MRILLSIILCMCVITTNTQKQFMHYTISPQLQLAVRIDKITEEIAKDLAGLVFQKLNSRETDIKNLQILIKQSFIQQPQWNQFIDLLHTNHIIDSDFKNWLSAKTEKTQRVSALHILVSWLDLIENKCLFHGTWIHNFEQIQTNGLDTSFSPMPKDAAEKLTEIEQWLLKGPAGTVSTARRHTRTVCFAYSPKTAISYAVTGPEQLMFALMKAEELLTKKPMAILGGKPLSKEQRAWLKNFISQYKNISLNPKPILLAVPVKYIIPAIFPSPYNFIQQISNYFPKENILNKKPSSQKIDKWLNRLTMLIYEYMRHRFINLETTPEEKYDPKHIYIYIEENKNFRFVPIQSTTYEKAKRTCEKLAEIHIQNKNHPTDFASMAPVNFPLTARIAIDLHLIQNARRIFFSA